MSKQKVLSRDRVGNRLVDNKERNTLFTSTAVDSGVADPLLSKGSATPDYCKRSLNNSGSKSGDADVFQVNWENGESKRSCRRGVSCC